MNKQGKDKIEWTHFSINPVKGICKLYKEHPWCYAVGMYNHYGWNPEVRLDLRDFNEVAKVEEPSKFFVCSTHEFYGEWILKEWRKEIYDNIWRFPQHIFQILTELPENIKHDVIKIPDNVWLGVTVQTQDKIYRIEELKKIKAKLKFASFEPLHSKITVDLNGIDWIIIGAETGNRTGRIEPCWAWVDTLIWQASILNIPVFCKSNLAPYKPVKEMVLLKEFPKSSGAGCPG